MTVSYKVDCRNCGGDGYSIEAPICPACNGSGWDIDYSKIPHMADSPHREWLDARIKRINSNNDG